LRLLLVPISLASFIAFLSSIVLLEVHKAAHNLAAKTLRLKPRTWRTDWFEGWYTLKWEYRCFYALNGRWPALSWSFLLPAVGPTVFFEEYRCAWRHKLEQKGPVVEMSVCLGQEMLRVPILFDSGNQNIGSDRETFEMLHMWYSYMQSARGFGELLLPRRLARVFIVSVSVS